MCDQEACARRRLDQVADPAPSVPVEAEKRIWLKPWKGSDGTCAHLNLGPAHPAIQAYYTAATQFQSDWPYSPQHHCCAKYGCHNACLLQHQAEALAVQVAKDIAEAAERSADFDYCANAVSLGFTPCEGDGTSGDLTHEQELAALQNICSSRGDCVGIHQQPDASLHLCRGPSLTVSYPEGVQVTGRGQLMLNPTPKRWTKSWGTCTVLGLGHEIRGYEGQYCHDNPGACDSYTFYCKNARQLGLALCENTPGYSADDELKAAQAICAAREDCGGIFDKNDDGSDIFLCRFGITTTSTQTHSVYIKPQTSLPKVSYALLGQIYNSLPGLAREQTTRWLPP